MKRLVTVRVSADRQPPTLPEEKMVISWIDPILAAETRVSKHLPAAAVVQFARNSSVHIFRADLREIDVWVDQPAENLIAVAILDTDQSFWDTAIGGAGKGLLGVADDRSFEVRLDAPNALHSIAASPYLGLTRLTAHTGDRQNSCSVSIRTPTADPCASGERVLLYLLPGLGSDGTDRLVDTDFIDGLASIWGGRANRYTLLAPDMRTPHGSYYISDRSVKDGWLELLSESVFVAANNVLAYPLAQYCRVLVGHSTGGVNALQLAMRCPGLFQAVVISAPDALNLASWLLDECGRVRPEWLAWMRLEDAVGGPGQMTSYAESWRDEMSPGSGIEWPFDLVTGSPKARVLARWLRSSTSTALTNSSHQESLRRLQGQVLIGAAENDEFDLFEPARQFSQQLEAVGVSHTFIPDHAGHFGGSARLVRLLSHLSIFRDTQSKGQDNAQ